MYKFMGALFIIGGFIIGYYISKVKNEKRI